ncbi:MAG: hypothetical protein PHD48_05465 [Alphaproteobacteria bacterium]|nr:hypothetical protein [Alphaproteobacteria bacterium]
MSTQHKAHMACGRKRLQQDRLDPGSGAGTAQKQRPAGEKSGEILLA